MTGTIEFLIVFEELCVQAFMYSLYFVKFFLDDRCCKRVTAKDISPFTCNRAIHFDLQAHYLYYLDMAHQARFSFRHDEACLEFYRSEVS